MEFLKQLLLLEAKKPELPEVKAQHKKVNDVLLSKKGGRHRNEKTDYDRVKDKESLRKETLGESIEKAHMGADGEPMWKAMTRNAFKRGKKYEPYEDDLKPEVDAYYELLVHGKMPEKKEEQQ